MTSVGAIVSASGIRGVFGETLTENEVIVIVNRLSSLIPRESVVLVGRDTRASSEAIKNLCISVLTSRSHDVIDLDVLPTPAVCMAVRHLHSDCAIMVTASHNPPEWNGLKFIQNDGTLFTPEQMEAFSVSSMQGEYPHDWRLLGEVFDFRFARLYVNRLLKEVARSAIERLSPMVVVDAAGGATCETTVPLLSRSGCKVLAINCSPGVFSRTIEPSQEAIAELCKTIGEVRASLGIAHDLDGDRSMFVDEKGKVLREDLPVAAVIDFYLLRNRSPIVVNVASSEVFRHVAEKHGVEIHEAPVGESMVLQKMLEKESLVGAEGSSGGLILKRINPTRDGGLLCIKLIELLAERQIALSEIIEEYPSYYSSRRALAIRDIDSTTFEELRSHFASFEASWIDGLKLRRKGEWILIRRSRTEPKVRVMTEARSRERADQLLHEADEVLVESNSMNV